LLRLTRTVWLTGLLRLSGTILLTRLLRSSPVLTWRSIRRSIRLLRAGSARRVATDHAGIGAAERALLVDDLPADGLRGLNLTHKTLIARDLLR
jgi:hypothetical protein